MDAGKMIVDLTEAKEVRFKVGDKFVATTPEHLLDVVSWLVCNVDTYTRITELGVEPDDYPLSPRIRREEGND